jgi:ribosome maturation protein Sdo1
LEIVIEKQTKISIERCICQRIIPINSDEMKVIVEIPDHEANFAMKVLKSLSFIKKARPMSQAAATLLDELKEASEQVRLHKQGKLKLKTAQELLDEL